jgi:hypothetical protein
MINVRDQKTKIFEIDDENNVNILNVKEYFFSIHRFVSRGVTIYNTEDCESRVLMIKQSQR